MATETVDASKVPAHIRAGQTTVQAKDVPLAIRQKQGKEMTHVYRDPPYEFAKTQAAKRYNIPIENIDMSGGGYIDRFRLGLGADTAKEREQVLSRHHQDADIQTVEAGGNTYTFIRPKGSDRAYFANPPGAEFGDIVEAAGQEGADSLLSCLPIVRPAVPMTSTSSNGPSLWLQDPYHRPGWIWRTRTC